MVKYGRNNYQLFEGIKDKMKLSIVITFYKNFKILFQCLFHLKRSLKNIDVPQIIVINDNPSLCLTDNTEIKKYFKDVIIIDNKENYGYAEACNIAIEAANGEIIVLLDCDIMVHGDWLKNMYDTLISSKDIGGVSSIILNMENNTILHFGFATNKIDMIKPYFCRPVSEIINNIPRHFYEFSTLTSGCCMFKKSVYLQVGGMDKRLYNGYCDLDLFYKMKAAGFKNVLCHSAYVYHRGGVSEEARTSSKTDTKALFCSKWCKTNLQQGQQILKSLYKLSLKGANDQYILYNFSSSLFSDDYVEILSSLADIKQTYKIKILNCTKIILEDVLSISIQNSNFSLIYFCDDFRQICNNYFWFYGRKQCGDLVIDRNGNVIRCDNLLK